jgi:hypothetical protein
MQYPHHFRKMMVCNTLFMFMLPTEFFFADFFVDFVQNPNLTPQGVLLPM